MKVVVLGVTSGIGREVVYELARRKYDLVCCARDMQEVKKVAKDVAIRFNVVVDSYVYDAQRVDPLFFEKLKKDGHEVDKIIVMHGFLSEDDVLAVSPEVLQSLVKVNFESVVRFVSSFIKVYGSDYDKGVVVVSSVAGERGKSSLLVYGAMKKAVSVYLEGMRQATSMAVLDVRPGYVDTPMIYGKVSSFLAASPSYVARDIVLGMERRRRVMYTPFYWKYIMFVFRSIPGFIFDRLKF
jgi:decaprenylphospho-beta-D-erythro-pentofuranosid-2-ulose 2-reductase